jgi:hypothetical protein
MDSIMRSSEWQQKMLRGGLRVSKLKDKDGNERRNKKVSEHRTKYPTRLKKSQTTLLSASKYLSMDRCIYLFNKKRKEKRKIIKSVCVRS